MVVLWGFKDIKLAHEKAESIRNLIPRDIRDEPDADMLAMEIEAAEAAEAEAAEAEWAVDAEAGEIPFSNDELEILLITQLLNEYELSLREILSAIAWDENEDDEGSLSPCTNCLAYGWLEPDQDPCHYSNGQGRCGNHLTHSNENLLERLENEVFPFYEQLLM